MTITAYKPLSGFSYIPLPKKLRACCSGFLNVKNRDNLCFKWGVIASLHSVKRNPDRLSSYLKYSDELDFTNLEFPMKINDISKFEMKNNISVCVFAYETGEIYPRYISEHQNAMHDVDLLLLQRGNR